MAFKKTEVQDVLPTRQDYEVSSFKQPTRGSKSQITSFSSRERKSSKQDDRGRGFFFRAHGWLIDIQRRFFFFQDTTLYPFLTFLGLLILWTIVLTLLWFYPIKKLKEGLQMWRESPDGIRGGTRSYPWIKPIFP